MFSVSVYQVIPAAHMSLYSHNTHNYHSHLNRLDIGTDMVPDEPVFQEWLNTKNVAMEPLVKTVNVFWSTACLSLTESSI